MDSYWLKFAVAVSGIALVAIGLFLTVLGFYLIFKGVTG